MGVTVQNSANEQKWFGRTIEEDDLSQYEPAIILPLAIDQATNFCSAQLSIFIGSNGFLFLLILVLLLLRGAIW
jgi:hypothetical protein